MQKDHFIGDYNFVRPHGVNSKFDHVKSTLRAMLHKIKGALTERHHDKLFAIVRLKKSWGFSAHTLELHSSTHFSISNRKTFRAIADIKVCNLQREKNIPGVDSKLVEAALMWTSRLVVAIFSRFVATISW
jgi:hypothetical protein